MTILYADFAAMKRGLPEALELKGIINAIYYVVNNNKWSPIHVYTNC